MGFRVPDMHDALHRLRMAVGKSGVSIVVKRASKACAIAKAIKSAVTGMVERHSLIDWAPFAELSDDLSVSNSPLLQRSIKQVLSGT